MDGLPLNHQLREADGYRECMTGVGNQVRSLHRVRRDWVSGFVCEAYGLEERSTSRFGGRRSFLENSVTAS